MDIEPEQQLDQPAVVLAFSGWNDAGNAASDAVQQLLDHYPATELDRIDDERFYDFQATRPYLKRSADGSWIQWPELKLLRLAHPQRDLIVAVGPEPSLQWRSYARTLIARIEQYQPSLCVLLGAMLSDSPHSRPLPVTLGTLDHELRHRLGLEPLNYEGPTGIVGVVNQTLVAEGYPTASMWVAIPHYVSSPPNPKGQLALLQRLEQLLEIELDLGELAAEAADWTEAVEELSQDDPDVAEYVERLEQVSDAQAVEGATGETIAADFERYLRGRDDSPQS